jgi:hypothetical protein
MKATTKTVSAWLSLASGTISVSTIVFVKTKFIFESGNTAIAMIGISMIIAILAFIFGLVALPRWQGIVALAASCSVAYCILFTRLYVLCVETPQDTGENTSYEICK